MLEEGDKFVPSWIFSKYK